MNEIVEAAVNGMIAAGDGVNWCSEDSVDGDTEFFARAAVIAALKWIGEDLAEYEDAGCDYGMIRIPRYIKAVEKS